MKLYDLLDEKKLWNHLTNGMVCFQKHPTLPLRIYNYTNKAAFEPAWGDGTIDYCRGLIVDADDNIVARPFKKFHNLNTPSIQETLEENLPKTTPKITKKADGSLAIWYPDGTPEGAISTRGSFTSDQAIWATKWWKAKCQEGAWFPIEWNGFGNLVRTGRWTPLFEIIYPENRIVVDYKGFEGLICIGGVNLETGEDIPRYFLEHSFHKIMVEEVKGDLKSLEALNTPNEEGFVVAYDNGLRVKIKFEDYKRLHRLITGVNPRVIWEYLRDDKAFDDLGLPENFIKWVNQWDTYLTGQFLDILEAARVIYHFRPVRNDDALNPDRFYRAECARYFAESTEDKKHLVPVLFALLDGKDPAPTIWKQIEPAGNDKRFQYSNENKA